MNEDWFKELSVLQRKQDIIDSKEAYLLQPFVKENNLQVSAKKPVGRPATKWILVNEVLSKYDQSLENGKKLSLRKLERAMNGKVKFLTIRRILMLYRPGSFPKNK